MLVSGGRRGVGRALCTHNGCPRSEVRLWSNGYRRSA